VNRLKEKAFGSGYFGEWIEDSYGLPAYLYTCNQVSDPKSITRTHQEWRDPREHLHQVGNDRLVAVVSNYGHVFVRQDEGSPKFLNDYLPENLQFAGGFGYLTDGSVVLSTYYSGKEESFERVFGIGYYRKKVAGNGLVADQTIFAPYGDDPLLISQVYIENTRSEHVDLRWIEYWGSQPYQFSMKSFVKAAVTKEHPAKLRRELARCFSHSTRIVPDTRGLEDTLIFAGEPFGAKLYWRFLRFMLHFVGKETTGGPIRFPVKESVLEDLSPPPVFLVSLDASCDGYATNASRFFGSGGVEAPEGIQKPFESFPTPSSESESGLFIERKISLGPGESKTLYFAYGYLPDGFNLKSLMSKYETAYSDILSITCEKWKKKRIELDLGDEKWVNRELTWHNYYLRSALTFDGFFREHILSQGHVYQYLIGFQGAARDPLQHALPFVYSEPSIAKSVLRYTLKSVLPDGEIPYGITGSGMRMPSPFRPSDQEMWLLWLASEYILATRDHAFLDETIPTYPLYGRMAGAAKVRDILHRCYLHLTETTGTGRHGLQRLSNGDWNDAMVLGYVPKDLRKEVEVAAESVLNAAMASYCLSAYSQLLEYAGDTTLAKNVEEHAEAQRRAVREQWAGNWFKRSWLTDELGWVGEDTLWLEPQPWAIIGGAATPEQMRKLVASIDENVRRSQKCGAMILGKADAKMEGDPGTGTNAGVWPSINGTLVWALSLVDGAMAWDEWKKNSLAFHADAYPDIWYGIWSGPDTYNSNLSIYPGGTIYGDLFKSEAVESGNDEKNLSGVFLGMSWTDFPVMNLHSHAWPLYTVSKLLGIEFRAQGIDIMPSLPKESFQFSSPLLDLEQSVDVFRGRYSPLSEGVWTISLKLDNRFMNRISRLVVNGKEVDALQQEGKIVFSGEGSSEQPLVWELMC
jgi:hypothetical protein